MKYLIFVAILFSSPLATFAEFSFNENCRQAYSDVMCLKFNQATARIDSERKLNPGNQAPYIMENYIDFLKVMIGEEDTDFERLQSNKELRLQALARDGKKSEWFLYSQALIYLQSGVARIKFEEYVNAGLDINRAYRLLTENQKKHPDFVMNKVGLGILHSLIGTVPVKYRWAVNSLNFEGTIQEGSQEINEAFTEILQNKELHFLLPETSFLLTFVTLNIVSDVEMAVSLVEKLNTSVLAPVIKESPLLSYALANVYLRSGNNDKAIAILSNSVHLPGRYPFHYLNYMLGVAKLNRLDKDANFPLLSFLGNFRGKNYIRSAYLHLAWYYLINNDNENYRIYTERIKLRGSNQVDNDREALNFATKNQKPDIPLLKARLLSDGGYYARALDELENFKSDQVRDKLEYSYRMGRIYHKNGMYAMAEKYYLETIVKGENQPYYYAANASLQLGLIYENQKNYSLARNYFNIVLDLEFDEYQFSLQNKAEAGLNRIKGK